jgi:NTE family protein
MKIKLLVISVFVFGFIFSDYAQTPVDRRPKIGVVLSGGGAKGLAHIGVLKVLEKAGIPIDYIGGTSMGAIIGGLYAIGYTADQLDSITRSANWDDILSDKVQRRNLSMVEKDEGAKYMISFPIRENKIALPMGIVSGQNISTLFSDLCSPVYNKKDFSKFSIPYLCIAADVGNARAVVLKNGNLAEAMRASMAIPTVFSPEYIDGNLLLDGGLINNFPVKEVRDMGADIIIGVEVGFNTNKKRELNSFVRIMQQSMLMYSREQSLESRKLCDILVLPDLEGYNVTSFNRTDSLIARGEKGAMLLSDKINQLADMLRDSFQYVKPAGRPKLEKIDRFYVEKIKIDGLKDVPENFLLRKIPFRVPSEVRTSEIEKFIQNIYGTWFFERITYNLEPSENGVTLVFKVIERNTDYFRAGLHFDSDFKTTLDLNTTFRNLISKGSKISLDLALGENPSFSVLYYKNSGWNPRNNLLFWSKLIPDYGFHFQFHNIEVYDYVKDVKTASLGFVDITSEFFVQGNISNSNVLGIGILADYTSINERIANSSQSDQESFYFNLHGYYKIDSYDQAFFPSRGIKLIADAKYIKGISYNVNNNAGFFQASIRANFIQALGRHLSVSEGIYGGTLFTDTAPSQYWFYMGGMGANSLRGLMPFVGLDFMQRAGNHLLVSRFDIQWELWKDNFFTIKTNVGKSTRRRENLLKPDDIVAGYGLSYGYRSPIGPMELTVMSSNKNPGLSFYVSIGYWF